MFYGFLYEDICGDYFKFKVISNAKKVVNNKYRNTYKLAIDCRY